MPFARNHRSDPRRSSPYCSTTNIVVLFALCLVGIWMMTSSTGVNVPSDNVKSEVKQETSENDAKQFQDSNGDLSVDASKADVNTVSNNIAEATSHVDDSAKENDSSKQESVATSENGAYSDANGKLESGETVKNDEEITKEGDSKSGSENTSIEGKEDSGDKTAESSVNENKVSEEEKGNNQNSDQEDNRELGKEKTSGQESDQTETKGNGDNTMKQENESNGDIVQEEKVGNQNYNGIENSEENKSDSENSEEKKAESDNSEERKSESENSKENKAESDNSDERKAESENSKENKAESDNSEERKAESENSEEKKAESENYAEKTAESQGTNELLPSGGQSELLNETNTQNGAWSTQASESKNEKEMQASSTKNVKIDTSGWKLCNVTAGPDYIPCLDNEEAIKKLRSTGHYEHRERHCPENPPTCLVPLPDGYKKSIEWPSSRDKIWYHNVPHTKLAVVKGHQNWVKVSGEYLTFPGGGTQFKHGALHYIDVIQESLPDIKWGKRSRVVLDVGCGVASFGGYLFDRDVLTMSLAPKDEHEAQVQFALERGIPAISAVMGTKRLPFPGIVFDVIHCARCRVPWHIEGGKLLLELNRMLRPGGYFVWSATPVYQKLAEDKQIWKEMTQLMKAMCWDMVVKTRDSVDKVGLAIFKKPANNTCYEKRMKMSPPFCQDSDDPNAAWNVPLQTCMHKLPVDPAVRGSQWPAKWPVRLTKPPYWLDNSQTGVYGKPAPEDFKADQEHWNTVVSKSYMSGMGIDWSKIRNVMDMRAVYGGFAAALKDMKLWVMNIVSIDSPDTLPIIYERGLFGMYHDWCESFSTYPRSYDLLHADHLFSRIKKKCKILPLIVEVDRMLRPEGKLIVRDTADTISEVESIAKSLKWEVRMTFSKKNEGILCVMKTEWRPKQARPFPKAGEATA